MSFNRTPIQEYMSIPEICEALGDISTPTLYRWMKLGLPSHQPSGPRGRRLFLLTEVQEWMERRWISTEPGQPAGDGIAS